MIETVNRWDTALFYFINSHHCAASDWLLWTVSQGWAWVPVLAAAYCVVCQRVGWRKWGWVLIGGALCFLLADRVTVMGFKEVVCRLRPCHALEGVRMFHTRCGGLYGFVSGHAANSAAIAVFLCLLYRIDHPGARRGRPRLYNLGDESNESLVFSVLMSLWVLLVCYSRLYLGKHYPGDVICGALVGAAIGVAVYFCFRKLVRN